MRIQYLTQRLSHLQMADVNKLSDSQIVAELKRYGEIIELPIKHTKRKILLKKLNHLRARSKIQSSISPQRQSSTKVLGTGSTFSSSYFDHKQTESETTNRHKYSNHIRPVSNTFDHQESSLYRDLAFSDDSDLEYESNSPFNYTSTSSTKNSSYEQGHDDNSSRDITDEDRRTSPYLPSSSLKTARRRTIVVSQDGRGLSNTNVFAPSNPGEDEEKEVSPGKSRLYPSLSLFSLPQSHGNKETFESSDSDVDADKKTAVGHKLFFKSFQKSHQSAKKDTTEDISPSLSYNYTRPGTWKNPINGTYRAQKNKSKYFENFQTILIGIAIIIIALAVTYLVLQKDDFSWFSSYSNMGNGDHLLLCKDANQKQDCYEKDVVDKALLFLQTLFEELSLRKGQVLCGTANAGDDLIDTADLKTQIDKDFTINTTIDELIKCCLEHILVNPHWNIRALKEDGSAAVSWNSVVKLKSEKASMSVLCRLRRSFNTVVSAMCVVIIVIGVLILLILYIKHRLKQTEVEQREIYTMVENIIEILQDHCEQQVREEESDELPYLVVQHVRDRLLPPASRYKLQPIWDKAVSFIAANESRIRLETRLIHGEEFEVWRWLQPTVLNDKTQKFKGFGKKSNSERPDQDASNPTPCLKISNLYNNNMDSDDGWKDYVIDAILKRCEDVDSIVHVGVDDGPEECHVFVKCSDSEAANLARDILHDWLFDGQRIKVSPLKTDHYYKRWPEARYAVRPLK